MQENAYTSPDGVMLCAKRKAYKQGAEPSYQAGANSGMRRRAGRQIRFGLAVRRGCKWVMRAHRLGQTTSAQAQQTTMKNRIAAIVQEAAMCKVCRQPHEVDYVKGA